MMIKRLIVKNWRNFRELDVPLRERQFIVGANASGKSNLLDIFREVVLFLRDITYLHLVPQLLRFADSIQGRIVEDDPFGQGFLERIATVTERTRRSRLQKIEQALKIAVPQLEQLEFIRDEITGRSHLQALYSHWRPNAGLQREDQFSDGTLRNLERASAVSVSLKRTMDRISSLHSA